MYVPSLQPISSSHFCVSGDVTIHPTATIAAGVLLQADPGSQVIVGAGVCLGMGSVLHAHQGLLEIEAEVTVGTGVLIIGCGKIGASACIGSASTIWNHSVEGGTVVPPLSLLGKADRQGTEAARQDTETEETEATAIADPVANLTAPPASLNGSAPIESASPQPTAEIQPSLNTPVYGQASLNRLLTTLLPHRHLFNPSEENRGNDGGGNEESGGDGV